MTKKKILCIIDMQGHFGTFHKDHIDAVLEEIFLAKLRRYHIVVVEYNKPPTIQQIIDELGCTRYSKVIKREMDGSRGIIKALKEKKISPSEFLVCGYAACCCVAYTVQGLRKKYGVDVVNVVATDEPWSENFIWENELRQYVAPVTAFTTSAPYILR